MKRLASLGMLPTHRGMGALDMNTAEDAIVGNTREVVPGMVVCGMELAEVGWLLVSGRGHQEGGSYV